jgi:uncharacterized phage protein gp47/JayE
MSFGVTTSGFNLKRFEDIKSSIITDLQSSFGQIDTDADSVFGQIIGVVSRHLAEIWEQSENVYNAMYPSFAEGVNLDNSTSLVGITRLPATTSTVIVELLGTEGTNVPSGTLFSQILTNLQFQSVGVPSVISQHTCHKAKVEIINISPSTNYVLTIDGTTYTYVSGLTPTINSICDGLIALINSSSTKFEGKHITDDNFLIIEIVEVNINYTFDINVDSNMTLLEFWTPIAAEAVIAGAVSVPINSITSVINPIFGLTEVTNISDGVTGRNVETDTELRIRRRNNLNISAAGTLGAIVSHVQQDIPEVKTAFIFENNSDIIDAYNRPPHSFEVIVSALDILSINQKIGNKIWERKPAGIATFGTTSVQVLDSNGEYQTVNFSHAINKYAHVKLSYSKSGSDQIFPINGETIIKEAILALGTNLSFGSDLLIQPFAACGYAAGGVTNVICQLALTINPDDTPSWSSSNVVVAAAEYPLFDLTRITLIAV